MNRQRAELSEKNPYWLERHRFYELRHFCLQYPYWKKLYSMYDGYSKRVSSVVPAAKKQISPTETAALQALFYKERMEMVERCCFEAADDLHDYLLKGVTEGIGYNDLQPPCCKDVYYDIFRKFFFILSKTRN